MTSWYSAEIKQSMEHLALEQVPWFNEVTNKLGVMNDCNPNICKTVSKKISMSLRLARATY